MEERKLKNWSFFFKDSEDSYKRTHKVQLKS